MDKTQQIITNNILDTLQFHHIGVAAQNIAKEVPSYQILGYKCEEEFFEDPQQGIRGLFLRADDAPTLEVLENLEGSHTLDSWLNRGQKFYHVAYCVEDIEAVLEALKKEHARVISPLKESTYFHKKICFLMLPNRQIVELIEV